MKHDITVGQEYYFIYFSNRNNLPGGQFNLDNYEVLKGKVIANSDTVTVETSEFGILELNNTAFFNGFEEADNYRKHLTFI